MAAVSMAEAPADWSSRGHLERKILQVLRDAGRPLKAPELVKECQVPKKELNRVLYSLRAEGKVSLTGPATWRLGSGDPAGEAPTELAQPSLAQSPQQDKAAVTESPNPQLSGQHERIYKFLEANGPCKALHIAQALGMKTAKDVNPDLYKMNRTHRLSYDQHSKLWMVYGSEASGRRVQSAAVIYQQNPINMICQSGPNSQISIANSEATQIGHGNVIQTQMVSGENGPMAPHRLPPIAPAEPSPQQPPEAAWGPQDIDVEQSMLQRVQLGHNNEMSLLGIPSEGPACGLSRSPPVLDTTAGLGAAFEVRMPEPGSYPKGDASQRIHVKSSLVKDTTIGNSNKMTVHRGAEGLGRVSGSGDGRRDLGEPEDAGPSCESAPHRSASPCDLGQAPPSNTTLLISKLGAMTLGSSRPEATELGLGGD